jgi:2-C-methyl-D-erythritol 4-phosphate cytidylyltransferase
VAGGSGTRMNAGIPKQFLILGKYPVLMHTLEAFSRYDKNMRIILVLPKDEMEPWKELCIKYQFSIRHELGQGGPTRFHSVKNNLGTLPDQCLIAIHDGVRPLVSSETIARCFESAQEFGNAIPCVEIPETLREIGSNESRQVDRKKYRLIQTPQVFKGDILKNAYMQEFREQFTDDAGVVESMGYKIHLVEGNPENIKITFQKDLIIASAFLR